MKFISENTLLPVSELTQYKTLLISALLFKKVVF
jgi:hypothetical protein